MAVELLYFDNCDDFDNLAVNNCTHATTALIDSFGDAGDAAKNAWNCNDRSLFIGFYIWYFCGFFSILLFIDCTFWDLSTDFDSGNLINRA